jgi:hypothetical protein
MGQTVKAAKGLPRSTFLAAGSLRYERIGMLVVSHQVGEPMTMRS